MNTYTTLSAVCLLIASTAPVSFASPVPVLQKATHEVDAFVEKFTKALETNDIDGQIACYAPKISPYYSNSNYTSSSLREDLDFAINHNRFYGVKILSQKLTPIQGAEARFLLELELELSVVTRSGMDDGPFKRKAYYVIEAAPKLQIISETDKDPATLLKIAQLMKDKQSLKKIIEQKLASPKFQDYQVGDYVSAATGDVNYPYVLRLELSKGNEKCAVQLLLGADNQIARVREIGAKESLAEARALVEQLVKASNEGSVDGQLACYASRVDPYFDKGVLDTKAIEADMKKSKKALYMFQMKPIAWKVEPSYDLNYRYDYMVTVDFSLSWKAKKNSRQRGRTTKIMYFVNARPKPEIVAAYNMTD